MVASVRQKCVAQHLPIIGYKTESLEECSLTGSIRVCSGEEIGDEFLPMHLRPLDIGEPHIV